MNDGDEDWIHEVGIKGNDSYYTGGGVPLDNLSQLYPYPEKPKLERDLESVDEDATQLCENSQIESNANSNDNTQLPDDAFDIVPSSPLIYGEAETQMLVCDKLVINTQELDKLAAMNESIDLELAELDKKLAESKESKNTNIDKENKLSVKESDNTENDKKDSSKSNKKPAGKRTRNSTMDTKVTAIKVVNKRVKAIKAMEISRSEPVKNDIRGITTTAVKDEKSIIKLTEFSDKFCIPIVCDDLQVLVVPTGPGFVVQKRTMKYFEALILGIEIVSFDWIEASLKGGRLLSRTSFEVCGDEISRSSSGKGRRGIERKCMFSGHKFYFYGTFNQPPRDQMEKLLLATGGQVLENVSDLTRSTVVLVDPTSQFTFETDAQIIKKCPIVGPTWVLDCISCGRVIDFHGYLVI